MSRRRHSKITTLLPPEVQEAVNAKLLEGKTYQEIADWINSLGYNISRASVGRYGKTFIGKLEEACPKGELRSLGDQIDRVLDEIDKIKVNVTRLATTQGGQGE